MLKSGRAETRHDPKKSRHFPFRTQRTSSTYSMPKANALLQNIADIILRLVEYMEDLEEFICDGIDCDIPAHPKRTVAPLRELGMSAKRMRARKRASELVLMFELLDKRTRRARRGGLVFKVLSDAA